VMDFATYARERLTVNETVLLMDTSIKCSSPTNNGIWDTECITRITLLIIGAGLSFQATKKGVVLLPDIGSG
jgi:hypothetical protein